jgi:hypothetical protein
MDLEHEQKFFGITNHADQAAPRGQGGFCELFFGPHHTGYRQDAGEARIAQLRLYCPNNHIAEFADYIIHHAFTFQFVWCQGQHAARQFTSERGVYENLDRAIDVTNKVNRTGDDCFAATDALQRAAPRFQVEHGFQRLADACGQELVNFVKQRMIGVIHDFQTAL